MSDDQLIADIIPIMRLPRGREFFTYSIPLKLSAGLAPGMIVRIPLQSQTIWGCVKKIYPQPSSHQSLLALTGVRTDVPALSPGQLAWLEPAARLSGASVPTTLKTFLPDIPSLRYALPEAPACPVRQPKKVSTASQQHLDDWLASTVPIGVSYDRRSTKERCLLALVAVALDRKRSVHILTARIEDAEHLARLCREAGLPVFILHSTLSKRAQWQAWTGAAHCQPVIIVSTKRYLLQPLTRPVIIVDDEEVDEFKQRDLDPRYDARELLPLLSAAIVGSLISFTRVPRIERSYAAKTKQSKLFRLRADEQIPKIDFVHLNVADENTPLLSPGFIDHIRTQRERDASVVIFHNRTGGWRFVRCKECAALYQCQRCYLPLETSGPVTARVIKCPGCLQSVDLRCQKCHSVRLKFSSPGVEIIDEAFNRLFPGSRIATLVPGARLPADTDILVVTRASERMLYLNRPPRVGMIGITLAEFGLAGQDYASAEHVWQFLAGLARLGQEWNCPVIAQAINPANPLFQALGSGNWDSWITSELDERRQFSYPPFTDLALVWYDGVKRRLTELTPAQVITRLKTSASIMSVLREGALDRRGTKTPALLLKIKRGATDWIELLPPSWKIDRNPDSIPNF